MNIKTNAALVVTANLAASQGGRRGALAEYSGIATTAALDQTGFAQSGASTVSTITTSTFATTLADEVIICMCRFGAGGTITGGTNFTYRSATAGFGIADRIVASTGTYDATETSTIVGLAGIVAATFKAPGAAAASLPPASAPFSALLHF